jgi:glycyl-tRNA synthetase beta chain
MSELLFELFSEEIPARMQAKAAADLARLVTEGLAAAGIGYGTATAHVTPRRLALCITGLPERQPDTSEERRGPRVGAPQAAVDGFLRGAGLSSLDQCIQRDTGKGVFWLAVIQTPGRPVRAVLPAILAKAVAELPWPKSMRWADCTARWVRPLHSVIAVLNGASLEGEIALGSGHAVPFGDVTRGHRFRSPEPFAVASFADYEAKLRLGSVVLDREERKSTILSVAGALVAEQGLRLVDDPGLLEELAGLVEWPVPLLGRIDAQFMDVPKEVLVTSMRAHQKYFAVETAAGALAPYFVAVANIDAYDGGVAMRQGYERVLRARLSDAKFFWDQDRRIPLESHLPALEKIVFHARLGSVRERVTRLEGLASHLAGLIGADPTAAAQAAHWAKCDLVTGMVGEFPELQGLMGRYYALEQGAPADVADAIATHYAPSGPSDACPVVPLSVAVALAEKLDTLVGFFGIGETPTGSKDPFALRRAALATIRLILENGLKLPLGQLLAVAHAGYQGVTLAPVDEVVAQLLAFFADRLKVYLRDRGVRHDMIAAVFALGVEDDLALLMDRAQALQQLLSGEDGVNLLAAYRRAANIVRIEEKKDGPHSGAVDVALLEQPEELALSQALDAAAGLATPALARGDFALAMGALAALRVPVDAFFDAVTVNAEKVELRHNRLRLLSKIRTTLHAVADFSLIEGG